jgi:16S rRNA (guanine527-N7)-methyltransferase
VSSYSRDDFAGEHDVTPEVLADFEAWHQLLLKWNKAVNLVSPSALGEFWRRHALDSWQVAAHLPRGDINIIDLGSGAGFPGIAVAIELKRRGQGRATLVESAGKKANFLKRVARDLNLPVAVTTERAEALPAQIHDVVSARAFAPLPRLLAYAEPFWGPRTRGLFLKGAGVEAEIEDARADWDFSTENYASRSDESGKLLAITGLTRHKRGVE